MPGIAINERISARLSQIAAALRAPFRLMLDVALPPLCPSCREPVGDGAGLCASCWQKLSPIERPFCEKLGIPFTYDPGPGIFSMQAISDPPAYARARAAVRYDDIARAMVHALKYGDRLDLAPVMARWMARAGTDLLADAEVVVPVPLHWRRMWARRFNQSAALAKLVAASRAVPVSYTALKRVKATPQQVGLSKAERAANVQGAFRVDACRQGRNRAPACGPGRRRFDLRRDRGCLFPRPVAGGCPPGGCAGVRAGCRQHTHAHIVVWSK